MSNQPLPVEEWKSHILSAFARLTSPTETFALSETEKFSVNAAVAALDQGQARVCLHAQGKWQVQEWLKQAILLYFRMHNSQLTSLGPFSFFDKIPVKTWNGSENVRVVPPAFVRYGAFVEPGAVLMPSYVNIGAYVGRGSLIDTWATIGSCAQVGANVHISGGVGLGGVLEPVQASPVIVEDNAFIGSRCIIVEGVRIEEGAVIGAGVVLTASTKIIDVTATSPRIHQGVVPRNSVVIPGTTTKEFSAGSFGVPCALIIGKRSESTDKKTSLNSVLREFEVPV